MTANLNIPSDLDRIFRLSEIRTFRLAGGPPYALVVHNPEMKLISDLWLGGFETQDRFRDVLEFIAECFESGGYSLWLADLRFMSTGFSPSGDWLVKTLMPRVVAAGLEREAVVLREDSGVPEGFDVFGAASDALGRIADGRVRGFTEIDAARRWLLHGDLPGGA